MVVFLDCSSGEALELIVQARIDKYVLFRNYKTLEIAMMTPHPDTFAQGCASREVLARIANKWSLLVIDALETGPMRNGALLRRVQGISQKMLTETLRELESLNIVKRHSFESVPPHVEYELTPLGRSLRGKVCELARWIENHIHDLKPVPDMVLAQASGATPTAR